MCRNEYGQRQDCRHNNANYVRTQVVELRMYNIALGDFQGSQSTCMGLLGVVSFHSMDCTFCETHDVYIQRASCNCNIYTPTTF